MRRKREIYIEVERPPGRKQPVWWVSVTEPAPAGLPELGTMLPGNFQMEQANQAARALGVAYSNSGYDVTLRTATRHGEYLAYIKAAR